MKGILKWPLIIAAIVVILRVIAEKVERDGGPEISGWLGVWVLHLLIVPIYIAVRLARSGVERPYGKLFKLVALYVVLVRAMVVPTYWMARIFELPEGRFAGTWGPDVNWVAGFVAVPIITALFWIGGSIVVGGGIGSLVIAVTGGGRNLKVAQGR